MVGRPQGKVKKEVVRARLPIHQIKAIDEHIEKHPWKTRSSVVSEAVALLIAKHGVPA